ncbi:MAG: PepSY domain-containing protein [Cytophagales bacterium]|nr:PepSY domain-containing protein [Cytophagales bacterium]
MARKKGWAKRLYQFSKATHKYIGIGLSVFLLWMSASGIILNHPDWFASFGVHKSLVPGEYHPQHWNRGTMNQAAFIGQDTVIFGGKQGVWMSTDGGKSFRSVMSEAFSSSPYFKKTNALLYLKEKQTLMVGTFGGLWAFHLPSLAWRKINLSEAHPHIVKLLRRNDQLLAFSKSHVYGAEISGFNFKKLSMKQAPRESMDLITYTFALHSGWLWGMPGRLVYDLVSLVLIFLTVTALYITFRKTKKKKPKPKRSNKLLAFCIRQHTKIGVWVLAFLLVIGATGIFMRPPLLIALVNGEVPTAWVPGYMLENPWYHSIRNAVYDGKNDRIIIDTTEGLYAGKADLSEEFRPVSWDVNIFVMGASVMEQQSNGRFLVGSFYGLFDYKEGEPFAQDVLTKKKVEPYKSMERPSQFMTTAYFQTPDSVRYLNTYGMGIIPIDRPKDRTLFPMPEEIRDNYRMPLWNYMFELHNARLLRPVFGKWVILFIPLTGLLFLFICFSGLYEYLYRNRKKLSLRR